MRWRRGVGFAVALSVATMRAVVPRALAGEQTGDSHAKARLLFNEGLDLRAAGQHVQALAKLREADATVSTPKTRLEVGRELVSLKRFVEGASVLESVASVPFEAKDTPKYEPIRKDAVALAGEARARIGSIRFVIGTSVADLQVDGHPVLTASSDLPVDPGTHVVSAIVDGASWTRSASIAPGEVLEVEIGRTQQSEDSPPAGVPGVTIGLFVAGGVALIGGAAFGLAARSTYSESGPHCGLGAIPDACDDEGARLRHTAGTRADIATGAFLVGAGLAASGAIVWWLTPSDRTGASASAGVRITPWSMSVEGRF